jgi:uncharacterized protein (TIGR04255 family)
MLLPVGRWVRARGPSPAYHHVVTSDSSPRPTVSGRRVEFSDPPIVEIALSVAFEPLEIGIRHLIEIWERELRETHPDLEIQPPFEMPIESVEAQPGSQQAFQFVPFPTSHRIWALESGGNHLVQLQRNFLASNWRRMEGPGTAYPRFSQMRDRLQTTIDAVSRYLAEQDLGEIRPTQVEVTYIDHIVPPPERGSYRLDEVLNVVTDRSSALGLSPPESARIGIDYPFVRGERHAGRLHVSAEPATRKSDMRSVIVLTTTARGKPDESTVPSALSFIDDGADAAQSLFLGITTDAIQHEWGRRDL